MLSSPSRLIASRQNLCVLLTTLLLGALHCPATSHAQSTFEELSPAQQQQLSLLGERIQLALEEGRHEHALATIEEAEDILPHPTLLLWRAEALEALGQYDRARATLEDFLARRPDHERAPELKVKLQDLQNRKNSLYRRSDTGSLTIDSTPPGAHVAFRDRDGRLKGSTPTVPIPVTRETTFYLIISRRGYASQERTIEVKPGEHRTLHVTLRQLEPAPDTRVDTTQGATPSSRGSLPWVLWGMGLVGVGGMIATQHRIQQFESMRPLDTTEQRQLARARGFFVGSALLAIAGSLGGTIVWIARTPGDPSPTSTANLRQARLGPGWLSLHF